MKLKLSRNLVQNIQETTQKATNFKKLENEQHCCSQFSAVQTVNFYFFEFYLFFYFFILFIYLFIYLFFAAVAGHSS